MLHPVGQFGLLRGQQHDPAVDARRLAASVDLRHPPHAQQRVGAGPEHQLLQIADPLEVPCLRRREDPLPQTPYVVLDLPPVDRQPVEELVLRSVHHPRTAATGGSPSMIVVMASNLSFGSGVCRHRFFTGSPDPRQHPFGSGHQPVSGRLSETAGGGADHVSRFPVAFRPPAFASWAILSRRGVRPSSRSAYRAIDRARTPTGFPRSARARSRPGWVPSIPRGRRCLPTGVRSSGRRLPLPSGQSLHPAAASHRRGSK